MKIIIAGCRHFEKELVYMLTQQGLGEADWWHKVKECVTGCADGVDYHSAMLMKRGGTKIVEFPADWATHGKAAGPIRNEEMAKYADALLLIWDGKSKGSKDMLRRALKHKLKVHVVLYQVEHITHPEDIKNLL